MRLWKRELQVLADELDLGITVCHRPPGTSEWKVRTCAGLQETAVGTGIYTLAASDPASLTTEIDNLTFITYWRSKRPNVGYGWL
jgi:hypothetical protein